MPVTLEDIEDALATVAAVIQANGERGMIYMPIFERLERERARFANIDDRLRRYGKATFSIAPRLQVRSSE